MTYTIKNTAGTTIGVVNENQVNVQFDITLIGKNYRNYGEVFNDNLIRMLENHANTTPPAKPITGELWWNTTDSSLYGWDGFNWVAIGGGGLLTFKNGHVGLKNTDPQFDLDVNSTVKTTGAVYANIDSTNQSYLQAGMTIGAPERSTAASLSGQGALTFLSDNPANHQLSATLTLVTDPDQQQRRFVINAGESDNGTRSISIAENGGFVGIGIAQPTSTLEVAGNLTVSGGANRVYSDFSNTNLPQRTFFQTSSANDATVLSVMPSGAFADSGIDLYETNNPNVSAVMSLLVSRNYGAEISSTRTGNGNYLPLILNTGDVETMRLSVDNRVGIREADPQTPLHIYGRVNSNNNHPYKVGILTQDQGAETGGSIGLLSANDVNENPRVIGYRSRGVILAPQPVRQDDVLLEMVGMGYDDAGYTDYGASIKITAGEDWNTASHGSEIYFYVNAKQTLVPVQAMRITTEGKVSINTDLKTGKLNVITDGAGTDGFFLGSPDLTWMFSQPQLNASDWNPLVEAGDSALIFSQNVADTGALVIAPWSNQKSGIRITKDKTTLMNFDLGDNFNLGDWNFGAKNWSGASVPTPAQFEGGIKYTAQSQYMDGNGVNYVNFGISNEFGYTNLYVDGAIRQTEANAYNYLMDSLSIGYPAETFPNYKFSVLDDGALSLVANFKSVSSGYASIGVTNDQDQTWEMAVMGSNPAIPDTVSDSFVLYNDISSVAGLVVNPDGKIGVAGIVNPKVALHIGDGEVRLDNNDYAGLRLRSEFGLNTSTVIEHSHIQGNDNRFRISGSDRTDTLTKTLANYDYGTNTWSFATNNATRLLIGPDGGIYTQNAAGGNKGVGTINAKGLYIDGVSVAAPVLPYPVSVNETWTNDAANNNVGQPIYYWGTNNGNQFNLYQSNNLQVARALNATNADTATQATNANRATAADSADALNPANDYIIDSLFVGTGAIQMGRTGEIRATDNITAYFSSDSRLKENVSKIPDALGRVGRMRGVMFDWTDEYIAAHGGEDGYFIRKHDVGVIAQEVEAALPEIVVEKSDGYLAVNYEKLTAVLIEAVNELHKKVETLEEKLNALTK
jgi:hypothetical protein